MAVSLQSYLIAQDTAVLDSFVDDNWCICAVTSVGELEALAGRRGRKVERLGTLDSLEASVVRHGDHAELWVRARRTDYISPFLAFAKSVHGLDLSGVPAGYNVDHLFNKQRVQTPSGLEDDRLPVTTLVRMLLVDARVNKSFGGLMESAMVGTGNPNRPYRRFTWLQLAKALSIDANLYGGGFGGANASANLGYIVAEMQSRGVCAAFPITPQQLLAQLQMQAATVNRYREL